MFRRIEHAKYYAICRIWNLKKNRSNVSILKEVEEMAGTWEWGSGTEAAAG